MIRTRTYGRAGSVVIVLHGGPAALGEAAPIARGLADSFQVLEPWQRGSGTEPLSVSRHIADLDELVAARCADARPALVGESWGAMLALAYAATHPERACSIVLIGCGTFDKASRLRMRTTLDERADDDLRNRLEQLGQEFPDPEERLKKRYELTKELYDVDPIDTDRIDEAIPPFDIRAHTETWNDMVRLQEDGVYPAAFASIESPVLMLHGAYDPHPGRMIRASLSPYLPQIEYREWAHCGHRPWFERAVRDEFFEVMRSWLHRRFGESA